MYIRIGYQVTWIALCYRYRYPHGGDPHKIYIPAEGRKMSKKERAQIVGGYLPMSEYTVRNGVELGFTEAGDCKGQIFLNCEGNGGLIDLGVDETTHDFTPEYVVRLCADLTDPDRALEVNISDYRRSAYGLSDSEDKDDPARRRAIVRAFIELWSQLAPGKPMPKLSFCDRRVRYGAYPKHRK